MGFKELAMYEHIVDEDYSIRFTVKKRTLHTLTLLFTDNLIKTVRITRERNVESFRNPFNYNERLDEKNCTLLFDNMAIFERIVEDRGKEYGFERSSLTFAPHANFKMNWQRTYRSIDLVLPDYLNIAPPEVIDSLVCTLLTKIRTGGPAKYSELVEDYLCSFEFLNANRETFMKRNKVNFDPVTAKMFYQLCKEYSHLFKDDIQLVRFAVKPYVQDKEISASLAFRLVFSPFSKYPPAGLTKYEISYLLFRAVAFACIGLRSDNEEIKRILHDEYLVHFENHEEIEKSLDEKGWKY